MNEEKKVVTIAEFLDRVNKLPIKTTNEKIFQPQRNSIHDEMDEIVLNWLKASGFEAYPSEKGAIINVPNEEIGAFAMVISVKIPNTTVDAYTTYAYDKKIKEKKLAEKQAKLDTRNKKIERDKLARAKAKAIKEKIIAE